MGRKYHNLAGLVRDCEAIGRDDSPEAERLREAALEALSALLELDEWEGDVDGVGDGERGAGSPDDIGAGGRADGPVQLGLEGPGPGDGRQPWVAPGVQRGSARREVHRAHVETGAGHSGSGLTDADFRREAALRGIDVASAKRKVKHASPA